MLSSLLNVGQLHSDVAFQVLYGARFFRGHSLLQVAAKKKKMGMSILAIEGATGSLK